jgi:fido (protein-threonine AMPylation protein)
MSDKPLSSRQSQILFLCQVGKSYSLSEVSKLLLEHTQAAPSAPTLRRDIATLCSLEFLIQTGSKKSTTYSLNPRKLTLLPLDAHRYCEDDIDTRLGSARYNFELFPNIPNSLFTASEVTLLNNATKKYIQISKGASSTIRQKELERFVIELSWKSSKIEGNTYSLLDTELLIKEGIEATGRTKEEAVMILNHKHAFSFILQASDEFSKLKLSNLIDIHRLLVRDLNIAYGLRSRLIGITGSLYRPLQVPTQIEEACNELLVALKRMKEPFSKALVALAGISYIQPFEDGNKRTSRLTANAILVSNGCAPLSFRSISEISYREAVLTFYEKNSLMPLKELFIEQYIFACENYLRFV